MHLVVTYLTSSVKARPVSMPNFDFEIEGRVYAATIARKLLEITTKLRKSTLLLVVELIQLSSFVFRSDPLRSG